jgi:hypothetical protein
VDNIESRIQKALAVIEKFSRCDGAHHKQWVIDQVVRPLTQDKYEEWVKQYEQRGEFEWDKGKAP